MLTVTLKPDVAEQVSRLASGAQTEADAIVDEAMRQYLRELRRRKIEAEGAAFEQQHAALLAEYRGQYVAIHEGRMIDHDSSLQALHLRVYSLLGHTPVLLKKVTDEPEREAVFRSPRFEREPH